MKIKELIYQDKISTPTDKKYILTSLISGGLTATAMIVLLVVTLYAPSLVYVYAAAGIAAGICFTVSLMFTVLIALRKRSLNVIISLILLIMSIALLIAIIIII